MKIVIAGSSGFVGRALVPALRAAGHVAFRLVRGRPAQVEDEIAWNPEAGEIDAARLPDVDAIINLAGENLGAGRWTDERRERIRRSRVDATRTLVVALTKMTPRPRVFLSASAIGFYGNRGDEVLTEAAGVGQGFLPEVCLAWETHAEGAARAGVRTGLLRFGTIVGRRGGALSRMLPFFRLGLGGRLGTGRQWMSWVSLDDIVGAILFALHDSRCTGPMNIVAPEPVTNAEFTATLGAVLHRPTVVPAPAWGLRLIFGSGLANEALLASTRAIPQRLTEIGYAFRHPALERALRAVVA